MSNVALSTKERLAIPPDRAAVVFFVLGLLLIAAALLKSIAIAQSTATASLAQYMVVAFELSAGFWLVLSGRALAKWYFAVLVFSLFAMVALTKLWLGLADCGCFGVLAISPRYAAVIDLGVVTVLFAIRITPGSSNVPPPMRRLSSLSVRTGIAALSVVLLGLLVVPMVAANSIRKFAANEGLIGLTVGGTVYLQPENWPGERFPLLGLLTEGEVLEHGKWIVVLGNPECDRCLDAIKRLEARHDSEARLAVVWLTNGSAKALGVEERWLSLEVAPGSRFSARTPVIVFLNSGAVKNVE